MRIERARIALIDDDPAWADTLVEYLGGKGFEARYEADPVHGLALLQREPFAVAVIDYHLPGTDGLELVRQARQRGVAVSVILVSNDDDPQLARRARAEGLQLLSKDAGPHVLVQVLEQRLKDGPPARDLLTAQ